MQERALGPLLGYCRLRKNPGPSPLRNGGKRNGCKAKKFVRHASVLHARLPVTSVLAYQELRPKEMRAVYTEDLHLDCRQITIE
jgi:hypothetical protein